MLFNDYVTNFTKLTLMHVAIIIKRGPATYDAVGVKFICTGQERVLRNMGL